MTTTADTIKHPEMLPDGIAAAILSRQPFRGHWLIGYTTKGGTYVIGSDGRQSDSGQPHDLIAVLPGDLGQGRVLPLYIAVNPQLVEHVASLLAAD